MRKQGEAEFKWTPEAQSLSEVGLGNVWGSVWGSVCVCFLFVFVFLKGGREEAFENILR